MTMPGYPCDVCRRAGGAVTINSHGKLAMLCSNECAKAYIMRGDHLKPDEAKAALKGGEAAGAYLDSIGKTDLAKMTEGEWRTFCGELFRGACEELRRQADDEIPF
jgi:hypothetical protein